MGSVHARQLTRRQPDVRVYEDYDVPFNNHMGIDFRPTRAMHEHVLRIDFHQPECQRSRRTLINTRDIFRYRVRNTRRGFRYSLLLYLGFRYSSYVRDKVNTKCANDRAIWSR